MTLKSQLTQDMKLALKAGEKMKLETIRFLISTVRNWEIDHGEQDDAGVQLLITKEAKKRRDAIEEFKKAGRTEIVKDEEAKLAVLDAYLPEQLSDEKLEKIVQEVIDKSEKKDFGPIIGQVMSKTKGLATGQQVAAKVKELLA